MSGRLDIRRAGRALAVLAVLMLAASAPPPVHAQVLQCSGDVDPSTGDSVAQTVLGQMISSLNYGWTKAAPDIDPLYPTDPDNPPGGKMFGTGTQKVGCNDDAYALCALDEFYPVCDHISAFLNGYDLVGMSNFSLTFTDVASTKQNPKNVSTHGNRGPDAGLVTDGVFAEDGTSWDDTTYAVILPLVGSIYGVTVDLGAVVSNICGAVSTCKGPFFQGDKNAYLFEYSSDGVAWQCYGQFPSGSDSGLRTRGATSLTASGCPATLPQSFSARYLRVSAYSGDGNYSVSELQVHDTGGKLLTLFKPAIGPLPAQIVSGTPVPDDTAWNDKHAVILPSTGPAHALVVDLGEVQDVCGSLMLCVSPPVVQADRNVFQLDYSTDSYNWFPFGQFPAIDSDGLHTRPLGAISGEPPPVSVSARYLRVWAVSGNGDYSVSQLSLYNTTGTSLADALISVGRPTYGPEPYVTNGEFAPDGSTDWNDPRYATVLRLCKTANSNSVCPSNTALTAALIVDLGSSFPVTGLTLQADRHSFQVDISSDRESWTPLYTFPIVSSGSGLLTRNSTGLTPATGRYLRVYGVEGDDSNYSVSELQVFTPVANTPCSYEAPDPNAPQQFSCSYDGQFTYDLDPNTTAVPLSFKVYSGEVNVICTNGLSTDTLRVATASKNAVCKANVTGPASTSASPTYPTGNFCAGSCQGDHPASVLTYAQFPDDPLPQFTATGVTCPIDSDFNALVKGLFEGVAAYAMNTVLNGVLGPHPGLTPYPASCQTTAMPPVDASKAKGRASQVGTGSDTGHVEIRGRFTAQNPLSLDQVTFTLTQVLNEVGGAGELVHRPAGSGLMPLTLQPRPGSTRDAAIFDTPPGVRPSVRMEVKAQNPRKNVYDFELTLDGVTMRVGPASCAGRRHPVARMNAAFLLGGSAGHDASVSETIDWDCRGTDLRAH